MENIIPLFVGGAITLLTEQFKKFGLSPRITLVILVTVAALVFTYYQQFIDDATKAQIVAFVTSVFGSAVFFYEYVLKVMKPKPE